MTISFKCFFSEIEYKRKSDDYMESNGKKYESITNLKTKYPEFPIGKATLIQISEVTN